MTDYLRTLSEKLCLYDTTVELLANALKEDPAPRILDLCSGSGGPVLHTRRLVEERLGRKIPLTLSDKYVRLTPVPGLFDFAALDALDASCSIPGFRTLFTSFHHFPRNAARQIIKKAVSEGSGVAIFELTDRRPLTFLLVALTPVYVFTLTFLIRPFSLHRFFVTYLLPIIPAAAAWDGLVSNLRSYNETELMSLCQGLEGVEWRAGRTSSRFGLRITYLIGTPLRV